MSQSKRQTIIEVVTNTSIGFIGSWLIVWMIVHLTENSFYAATLTTTLCTVWSFARGYWVRRYFNYREKKSWGTEISKVQ